jgi:hypothetical protein
VAIDIWCTRCGSHLDWVGEKVPDGPERRWRVNLGWTAALALSGLRRALATGMEEASGNLNRLLSRARTRSARRRTATQVRSAPAGTRSRPPVRLDLSASARALLAIAGVMVVALAVAAFGRTGAGSQQPPPRQASRSAALPPGSALAAAVKAVQATSGARFSQTPCKPGTCLRFSHEVDGLNAAAVEFSLGDGRACAAYLAHDGAGWQPVAARCASASELAPMIGRKDTVHVPGNCANVRKSTSLSAGVIACLGDGTAVTLDAGPNAGAGHLWWHLRGLGWMAQDFLLR